MDKTLYGNTKNPKVFVIGVFHGDEPQGNHLIREYLKRVKDSNLLMLPCLNQTGMSVGMRVNFNGVDLNRNFPTENWELGEKGNYYGGDFPASEEETQFIVETVEKYSPSLILTLHSPYKIVNYDGEAEEIAQKISEIIKYPVEKSIGYPTPGSFGTWAGIEKGIPVITLELDEEIDVKELEAPVFKIFELLENY